jgi:glycosyltransferase involved in cell wall biosynthesis
MIKIAIVRGKFLNRYELQFFEPLARDFDITAFGSLTPYHDRFAFPVVKLPSPMDLPDFPYKMPILNRLFTDAHYLIGLEERLRDFDLVHTAETYFRYTQQCLDAKRQGFVKKVIATVLENIPFNNEGIRGRKAYKRRAREELDHIIALTKRTKDVLITEGCEPSKITVISHFVDTKRFTPQKKKGERDGLVILFAGRLEKNKGVFVLLEAIGRLVRDSSLNNYNLTFRFVGDGSERDAMIKTERMLGISSVTYHSTSTYDDMPDVYADADIYVAPSIPTPTWEEQYNTTLLEAQASGLPIVTTKTGGIPENVGNAAILVPPNDAQTLAKALKDFIVSEKLRYQYGGKARKRAETVHDIRFGARKLKELYDSLLK